MNHGLRFLEGTVGDARKKFLDPESIFWVSNSNFLKTISPLYLYNLHRIPNTRQKKYKQRSDCFFPLYTITTNVAKNDYQSMTGGRL